MGTSTKLPTVQILADCEFAKLYVVSIKVHHGKRTYGMGRNSGQSARIHLDSPKRFGEHLWTLTHWHTVEIFKILFCILILVDGFAGIFARMDSQILSEFLTLRGHLYFL